MAVITARESDLAALEADMRGTPLLRQSSTQVVRALSTQGSIRHYRRGTYLFYQGDESDHVLFLWRGRIEVSSI